MMKTKFKNRKNSYSKTKDLYKILFLLVVFIGTGFAYFNTVLGIDGFISILNPQYNVYIDSVSATSSNVTATEEAAIIGDDKMEVDFKTALPALNSSYEVSTTLTNKGRSKAYYTGEEIKVYDASGNEISLPSELECTVVYNDNSQIGFNHELNAGSNEVFKIKFNYKSGATLPATQPVYTVKVVFSYALEPGSIPAGNVTFSSTHTSTTNIQDALDEIAGMLE